MLITVIAAGTRGDVLPVLSLSQVLQEQGYKIKVIAPIDFQALARDKNLIFCPLNVKVESLMNESIVKSFYHYNGKNLVKKVDMIRQLLAPHIEEIFSDMYEACKGSDAIICLGVLALYGQTIASVLKLPLLFVEPTPLLPTRMFPAPGWPFQKGLTPLYNFLTGYIMLRVIWHWYKPSIMKIRRELKLPALGASSFYRILKQNPLLGGYSPSVIRKPKEWGPQAHVTGYWFLNKAENAHWEAPQDLLDFLARGDKPICVGFSSLVTDDSVSIINTIVEAIQRAGERCLLLTGWSNFENITPSERLYKCSFIPYNWLFPRMKGIIHHGGAGSTAECLRAGVPSIIIAFAMDQAFWARRVYELKVGARPFSVKSASVKGLVQAIKKISTDPEIKQNCVEISEKIRAENGLATAVNIIRGYFGSPRVATEHPQEVGAL